MKPTAIAILSIFGLFLANAASAANHPRLCTLLRDSCKSTQPAAICEKAYQDAIAHGGQWNGPLFDRTKNDSMVQQVNCTP